MVKKYLRRAALVLSTSALLLVGLTGTASAASGTYGFAGTCLSRVDTPVIAGYDPGPIEYYNASSYCGSLSYSAAHILQVANGSTNGWVNWNVQSGSRSAGQSLDNFQFPATYNGNHQLIPVPCKSYIRELNWMTAANGASDVHESNSNWTGYQC